jgi:hypothetical protein
MSFEKIYHGRWWLDGEDLTDPEISAFLEVDIVADSYSWTTTKDYICKTYPDCVNRRTLVPVNLTGDIRLRPRQEFEYIAPSTAYGEVTYASEALRIESEDGTRWVQVYFDGGGVTKTGYFTCSNASEDYSYGNYSAPTMYDRYVGILTVNTDGTVYCKLHREYYTQTTCYDYKSTVVINRTTSVPIFNVGEKLKIIYNSTRTSLALEQFGWDITHTEASPTIGYIGGTLETMEVPVDEEWEATIEYVIGAAVFNVSTTDAGERAKWENAWDYDSIIWASSYLQIYNYPVTPYVPPGAKLKEALTSDFLDFAVDRVGYLSVGLMSTDEQRWIVVYQDRYDPYEFYLRSHNGLIAFRNNNNYALRWVFQVKNGYIYARSEGSYNLSWPNPTPFDPVLFTDIFNEGEKIHPIFTEDGGSGYNYGYVYNNIVIGHYDFPPPGQSQMRTTLPIITCSADELITQSRTCYVRTKIRNSQDYNDPASLFAMDPGHPSDNNIPLQENDACIVLEKYNRIYYYSCVSGDMQTNLPYIIRMTNQLYWELVSVTPSTSNIISEQYDVVGLVDTNEVIITHSKHNRNRSYAPTIQLIHNGQVRTHDITVAIKSDTELRISTPETSVITGLKINIYVNP